MNRSELLKSFYSAAGLLSEPLWTALGGLGDMERMTCREIRLRVDRPMELLCGNRSVFPAPHLILRPDDLAETLRRCTGDSVHTFLPQLTRGFATARGGHRFGICGEVVRSGGVITGIRGITSLNIRVARQITGVAEPMAALLAKKPQSLLIASRPGAGKTTLLRDLARCLSVKYRVAICDSRYELAGVCDGRPRFRIGACDVLSGAEPAEGLEMLVRTMSPQFLVTDEITGGKELEALAVAAFAGVALLASCHAGSPEELQQRPLYRGLLESGVFPYLAFAEDLGDRRHYVLYEEVQQDAMDGCGAADAVCLHGRLYRPAADYCSEPLLG